jgi:hypothetical protein
MSRCHPVTDENTDTEALKGALKTVKRRAAHLALKVKNGAAASRNMNSPVAVNSPRGSVPTTLTFPISVSPGTFDRLDVSGGIFTYTPTDMDAPYEITILPPMGAPLLGAQYREGTSPEVLLYSSPVEEGGVSATYLVHMYLDAHTGHEFDTSGMLTPVAPILLHHLDWAEVPWPVHGPSSPHLGVVVGRGTLSLAMYKSVDGEIYVYLNYPNKSGWAIPQGAVASALHLSPPPAPVAGEYEVNPNARYGLSWKNVRPAGYKKSWPYVATSKATALIADTEIQRAITLMKTDPRGQLLEPYVETIILDALSMVTLKESGRLGGLYLPQNGFDIRPAVGATPVPGVNFIDEGPVRRKRPKRAIIGPRRPAGTELISAGGPFQYVYATWRAYFDKYGALMSMEASERAWLWDARPEAQLWLQTCYLVEHFTTRTAPLRALGVEFPPLYLAMAVYVNNLANGYATNFINISVAQISVLVAAGDNTSSSHHLACKAVWDSASWVSPPKHKRFCLRNVRKAYCNPSFMAKNSMYTVAQPLLPKVWSA